MCLCGYFIWLWAWAPANSHQVKKKGTHCHVSETGQWVHIFYLWSEMIWALFKEVAIRRWGNSGYKGVKSLNQGRIDLCFHMVYSKFWRCHQYVTVKLETCQTRQHLSQPESYPVCWPCPGWWWTLRSTCGWGREMCSGWGCSRCQMRDLWPGSGM